MESSAGQRFVVHKDQATKRVVDEAMTIFDYFSGADSTAVDMVAAELDGVHAVRVNRRSTKIYYVEHGSVEFTVSGRTRMVGNGGAVLVRPGEPHGMVGDKARILIVCSPAINFDDEYELD